MKNILKLLLKLFGFILVVSLLFFFWASSPTMNEKEYAKLIENENPVSVSNDSVYSIVTYNVGYLSGMTNNLPIAKPKKLFDDNLNKVKTELKKVNPDIVAFQEIDYLAARSYEVDQEKEFMSLGYNYAARGVNWDEKYVPFPYWPPSMHFGKIVSGQSILSKYKLKEYERIVLERVPNSPFYRDALYLERLIQVVKVELQGKEVVVINIHLEAFDKATRVRQLKHALTVFNKYKNNYPTILLGDFNSKARDVKAGVQEIFKMEDVGNAAFIAEDPANTFDTRDLFERIDYIFYTKKTIEYVDGRVLYELGEASDHLPVAMQFRLK
ncbi:endonuclease/exonuclease/phosphatase family protein [Tenacibaculum insulae]|uniref:endonuclease/exonuclease/phosphatase family protein n=1 Tax=Tenacibaculum insulae TaxID=2029677 RepID=UPI003AB36834